MEGASPDATLIALALVVAALFIVTAIFSSYAVLLRFRNTARDKARRQFEERWQEPLLRAIADPDEAPALRESVREEEKLRFVGLALQYTRRVRGAERATLRSIVRPFLDKVEMRADSKSEEVRARAVQTLGTLGLPERGERLIAALDDRSPLVAMVAARALAVEGSAEQAEAVLARIGRFRGWNRHFLASMLAAMGPEVSAALRAGLADVDREPWARAVLADALQIQGDVIAGDVAASVLASSQDRELLVSTLRLLRDVGREDHAAAVREHLSSPDVAVRAQALRTLGALGSRDDLPRLVDAMRDADPWAALYAARGLRAAGGSDVLTEIAGSERPTAALARQVLAESASR